MYICSNICKHEKKQNIYMYIYVCVLTIVCKAQCRYVCYDRLRFEQFVYASREIKIQRNKKLLLFFFQTKKYICSFFFLKTVFANTNMYIVEYYLVKR